MNADKHGTGNKRGKSRVLAMNTDKHGTGNKCGKA